MSVTANPVCLCGKNEFEVTFTYREPPAGEVHFDFGANGTYARRILRCTDCGHFLSVHDMDMSRLYEGAYVSSTYGEDGLRRAFERIIALDPARSDNVGRVERLTAFAREHFGVEGAAGPRTILDVGSGLCVFLHRIKANTNWLCTALDPDPRAAAHARDCVGVRALCGDFMRPETLGRFDMITFNKVLEHVVDPVAMLAHSHRHLNPDGFVYIELPDGEAACLDGQDREEFFIDHHHVFSRKSIQVLAERAGFSILVFERIREPSTKYTLRGFLADRNA